MKEHLPANLHSSIQKKDGDGSTAYQKTIEYLFDSAPLFQNVGKEAYKEGLYNTHELDKHFGHPHRQFKCIHVAGTNGKGSCSHTIAAILQSAGYKVGLYTSPHLVDFRERIRINGNKIPEEYVIDFVQENKNFFEPLHPSFFELTTTMAFNYFAESKIDIAVIEVGLGGRLDCTNIINPELCLITNISYDHTQFLGKTIEQIATEKAGIIKPDTPVVIGEATPETRNVFVQKASSVNAPITFAEDNPQIINYTISQTNQIIYQTINNKTIKGELRGFYQIKNTNTILTAIAKLQQLGFSITEKAIKEGFGHVCELTGLMGRWQQLQSSPTLICDTGHNVGGITYIAEQLAKQTYRKLHIVIGMVNDKDIRSVLKLLPETACYYFTKASVKRALDEKELQQLAFEAGLRGESFPNVRIAVRTALEKASVEDLIFVGGSSFIVADLLSTADI